MKIEYRATWTNRNYRLSIDDILFLIDRLNRVNEIRRFHFKITLCGVSYSLESKEDIEAFPDLAKARFDSLNVAFKDGSFACVLKRVSWVRSEDKEMCEILRSTQRSFLRSKIGASYPFDIFVFVFSSLLAIIAFALSYVVYDDNVVTMMFEQDFLEIFFPATVFAVCYAVFVLWYRRVTKLTSRVKRNYFLPIWIFVKQPIVIGMIGYIIGKFS